MTAWAHSSKVALLACGSFNPPTLMHLRMMEVAKDSIERDFKCKVVEGIMSPVSDGYVKQNLARAEHRVAMLHIATRSSDWISADSWESSISHWTRTVAVLEYHRIRLTKKYGEDIAVVLVMGGDVVQTFTKKVDDTHWLWDRNDLLRIVREFGIICLIRDNIHPHEIVKKIPFLCNYTDFILGVEDPVCPNNISSTRIREAIRYGRTVKYALDDAIANYIKKNDLYS